MGAFTVIRSDRKTITMKVAKDRQVVVHAPASVSDAELSRFMRRHAAWLEKARAAAAAQKSAAEAAGVLSAQQVQSLAQRAAAVFAQRVSHFSHLLGVSYGRIGIRTQRSRWGSCSSKGNLSFNCLLLLAPPEVLDSVVVHELCHRKHMNHSQAFYDEVLRVFPEYPDCQRWLKTNGGMLILRLPE